MSENIDRSSGQVIMQPTAAEVIITANGTYAIMQLDGDCIEHIERVIAQERSLGANVSLPGTIDPATAEVLPFRVAKSTSPVTVFVAVGNNIKVKSEFSAN